LGDRGFDLMMVFVMVFERRTAASSTLFDPGA
jgi:hypothetical protein